MKLDQNFRSFFYYTLSYFAQVNPNYESSGLFSFLKVLVYFEGSSYNGAVWSAQCADRPRNIQ